MVAIGGIANIWGAIMGAALLTVLPEYLRVFRDYDILIYGSVLLCIMIFLPDGLLIGIFHLFKRKENLP